jgi:hypothetical protein
MLERFLDMLHLEGDGMEHLEIIAPERELPRVDGEGLSDPVKINPGDFWRLMNMAVKGKQRLVFYNEVSDGPASRRFSALNEIQSGAKRGGVHDIDRLSEMKRSGELFQIVSNRLFLP